MCASWIGEAYQFAISEEGCSTETQHSGYRDLDVKELRRGVRNEGEMMVVLSEVGEVVGLVPSDPAYSYTSYAYVSGNEHTGGPWTVPTAYQGLDYVLDLISSAAWG